MLYILTSVQVLRTQNVGGNLFILFYMIMLDFDGKMIKNEAKSIILGYSTKTDFTRIISIT